MNESLDKIRKLCSFFCGACLILMMVQIFVDVVLRLLYDGHIPGTKDIVAYYYMVIAVYAGIFVATIDDAHIRTDVLVQRFSKRIRIRTNALGYVITAIYFALFAYGLCIAAVESTQRGGVVDAIWFELLVWPARWIAAISILLAVLASLVLVTRRSES